MGFGDFMRRLAGLQPSDRRKVELLQRIQREGSKGGNHRYNRTEAIEQAIESIFDGTYDRAQVERLLSEADDD